jgi:hypothetical protein
LSKAEASEVEGPALAARALWTVDSTRGLAAHIDPTFKTAVRTVGVGDEPGWGDFRSDDQR